MYRRRPAPETAETAAIAEEDEEGTSAETPGAGPSNRGAVTPPASETPKKRKVSKALDILV